MDEKLTFLLSWTALGKQSNWPTVQSINETRHPMQREWESRQPKPETCTSDSCLIVLNGILFKFRWETTLFLREVCKKKDSNQESLEIPFNMWKIISDVRLEGQHVSVFSLREFKPHKFRSLKTLQHQLSVMITFYSTAFGLLWNLLKYFWLPYS